MKSKLIPENLLNDLPILYSQENVEDPLCQLRLVSIVIPWIWYIIEGEFRTVNNNEDFLCFGYTIGKYPELGYFSLSTIENSGALIVHDTAFKPKPLSKIKPK